MQTTADLGTLGKRLFYLRQISKKTLQEVSSQSNVSRSNLGKYEKDIVKPSADAIISLCDFYKVSTDWLLKGDTSFSNLNAQKNEVVFDPDLKRMVDILKELMLNNTPERRNWTILQFEDSFSKYCSNYDFKKRDA